MPSSTYRQLDVPGESELIGRGVHFCATCDGPVYRGKELVVIGGGNSALQETLFLARFASKITMLVRGGMLGGSEILREQVKSLPNVLVRVNTVVQRITPAEGGIGVKDVVVRAKGSEIDEAVTTNGVFVFIGLLPNTAGLSETIDADEFNFLKTGLDYSTNVPGVFVAGDVRSGSTWQIASAVGEGVSATLAVRKYLDEIKHAAREIRATI